MPASLAILIGGHGILLGIDPIFHGVGWLPLAGQPTLAQVKRRGLDQYLKDRSYETLSYSR